MYGISRTFVKMNMNKANLIFKFTRFNLHNLITSEKAAKLTNTIFIDARNPAAFAEGHVKGAVNIHEFFTFLSESTPEGMQKLSSTFEGLLQGNGVNGTENLVFYEDSLGSLKGVSCRGYYLMKLFGYNDKNLFILKDGFDAFKVSQKNLVEKTVTKRPKGTFTVKYNKDMFVDYLELSKKLNDKASKAVVVDVRDLEEWKGLSSSPYGPDFTPRKGRTPGAKHILWTDLMTADGKNFKSKTETEEVVKKSLGVTDKNAELIVYCFKGCRSSNSLVALKNAGFTNVKNYLASWNEWSRRMELPVEDKKL